MAAVTAKMDIISTVRKLTHLDSIFLKELYYNTSRFYSKALCPGNTFNTSVMMLDFNPSK